MGIGFPFRVVCVGRDPTLAEVERNRHGAVKYSCIVSKSEGVILRRDSNQWIRTIEAEIVLLSCHESDRSSSDRRLLERYRHARNGYHDHSDRN